jgi:hypothetical protein
MEILQDEEYWRLHQETFRLRRRRPKHNSGGEIVAYRVRNGIWYERIKPKKETPKNIRNHNDANFRNKAKLARRQARENQKEVA